MALHHRHRKAEGSPLCDRAALSNRRCYHDVDYCAQTFRVARVDRHKPRMVRVFIDMALVVAAATISLASLIESDSSRLIASIKGKRVRIMAATLEAEIIFAERMSLPVPDAVQNPKCLVTNSVWLVAIMGSSP